MNDSSLVTSCGRDAIGPKMVHQGTAQAASFVEAWERLGHWQDRWIGMSSVYESIYRVYDALQDNHEESITMQVAKSELLDLVNQMPEECELEDVQYRLYVLDKIKRGQKDIEEGRTVSHEEVKKRLSAKWQN